ncbi:hypothetical protein [Streptomyces sp. NPDC006631]|uniref:hypothetical protein n=1 Tax=Streptomyces sp. NPDC006631 TaxID=3364752 RepID=UPI0036BF26BA
MAGNLAPDPQFQERVGTVYERKIGDNAVRRGPLRFEEGVATDTDVPNEFTKGALQGYITAPGRPNHNANVYEKSPQETMAERVHVGSASWVEAPTYLGEFAQGSFSDYAAVRYEEVIRNGSRYERQSPAVVED